MSRHEFFDEVSWQRAWHEGLQGSGRRMRFLKPDTEGFQAAAHFIGGSLLAQGFRLFRNGGLPLLERRIGPLLEEIVIEPGPNSDVGKYVPLAIRVHISHEGLREVRERYWISPSRAPSVIASGHLGLLDDPPSWVLWNVAEGGRTLEELARWVHRLALPWFARFEHPEELRYAVLHREVRLLRASDALELVFVELGHESARRFLREIIEFGGNVSPRMQPLKRVDEGASLGARLDAIATCYRLR